MRYDLLLCPSCTNRTLLPALPSSTVCLRHWSHSDVLASTLADCERSSLFAPPPLIHQERTLAPMASFHQTYSSKEEHGHQINHLPQRRLSAVAAVHPIALDLPCEQATVSQERSTTLVGGEMERKSTDAHLAANAGETRSSSSVDTPKNPQPISVQAIHQCAESASSIEMATINVTDTATSPSFLQEQDMAEGSMNASINEATQPVDDSMKRASKKPYKRRRPLRPPKIRETCEGCSTFKYRTKNSSTNGTERPFRCHFEGCEKAYVKSSHMRQHMRIHSGDRPYVCEHPDCSMRFMRKDELTRHTRKHTGEKPFECDICHKTFIRSDHLALHQDRHQRRFARMMVKQAQAASRQSLVASKRGSLGTGQRSTSSSSESS